MNKLLDTHLVDPEEDQAQTNKPKQTNEETTMVLWDQEPTLGLSEDEPTKEIQVSSVSVTTRGKGPVGDQSLVLPKARKIIEAFKKIISTTQTKQNVDSKCMRETNPTINKPMETLANKTETTKEQGMGYDIIEDIKNYVICTM